VLTECINRYLTFIKDKESDTSVFDAKKQMRVLVTAFTGRAAHNIKGTTIHSAFHLQVPVPKRFENLSVETIRRVRKEFCFLRLIIIDEISQVSPRLFAYLDHRLRQIFAKPDTIFGGIPMVVIGDFNQLAPIMEGWIFKNASANEFNTNQYTRLNGPVNFLWAQFKYYKLNTIMRQQDKAFAEALTAYGEYGHYGCNEEHRRLFNSCIVGDRLSIAKDSLYLFTANNSVDDHNIQTIRSKEGDLITQRASHEIKGSVNDREKKSIEEYLSKHKQDQASGLPYEIMLKVQCKYQITINMNVPDGLTNGTAGTLMKISFDKTTMQPEILWFDFGDEEIGDEQRQRFKSKNKNNLIVRDVDCDKWTPIYKETCTMKREKDNRWSAVRSQFPVIEAEAVTIYKSQGLTYGKIAIDLSQNPLTIALLYVAMSRATTKSNLMLYGRDEFTSHPYNMKKARELRKNNIVYKELTRMKTESPFVDKFAYIMAADANKNTLENTVMILFHNVENLPHHIDQVRADRAVQKADILLFVECHTNTTKHNQTNLKLDNYKLVLLTGRNDKPSRSNGCAIYVKEMYAENTHYKVMGSNAHHGVYISSSITEMNLMSLNFDDKIVYLCSVYKHPKCNATNFFCEFKNFLKNHFGLRSGQKLSERIFVFGDFNFDMHCSEAETFKQRMHTKLGLNLQLVSSVTTDKQTTLDWCITNEKNEDSMEDSDNLKFELNVYESYFSYHKPLILMLKK
jgi:exonuclease III